MTEPRDARLGERMRAAMWPDARDAGWASRSPLFAAPPPGTTRAHDKALWTAGLLGALGVLEAAPGASARLGAAADCAADGGGGFVVRYRSPPGRQAADAAEGPPRCALAVLLRAATTPERAALRDAARELSEAGAAEPTLERATAALTLATARHSGGPAAAARARRRASPPARVGVVRVAPGSAGHAAVSALAAAAAGDGGRMARVLRRGRAELVDDAGRPRRLDERALDAAAARVRARALAYYALVLSRHARLVRLARGAAKMCVEGSETEYGGCAAPVPPE